MLILLNHMVDLDQILHIFFISQVGKCQASFFAVHGLLVKMLIIIELHIYFDQILHTGTYTF